jgi:hypothetical protein
MKFIKIISLLILLATTSCNHEISKVLPSRPDQKFKFGDSSPDYKKGFEDGCESGMAGGSNTFYKVFYRSNMVDGYKVAGSSDYKSAWGIGWWYCYRHDYVKHKSSIYGSFFRGYQ